MRPRKKKKSSFWVAFGIIFALIILVYILHYLNSNLWGQNYLTINTSKNEKLNTWNIISQENNENPKYFVWKQIDYIKWTLKEAKLEGLSYYFVFEGDNWDKFYLLSKQEDLNKFLWREIIVKWKVIEFEGKMPVVEVIEIYSPQLEKNELNPYTYEFISQGLYFDFSSNTWYYAYKDNNGKIVVAYKLSGSLNIDITTWNLLSWQLLSWVDQNIEKIVTIEGFLCVQKGNFFRNCKAQEQFAKAAYSDSFVSINGIKFYKIPESKQWFGTDKDYIWWYYFDPKDDDSVIAISDYIYPVTTGYLKQKILPLVTEICIYDDLNLQVIKDVVVEKTWSWFVAKVLGKDKNWNSYKCNLKLNLLDNMVKVDFEDIKLLNNVNNNESNIVTTIENDEKLNVETSYENQTFTWLIAKFKAGFVLYIPYSKLFYSQVELDTKDLGINNLSCDVQINIADKMENLIADPKIKIYRCKSELDLENLSKYFEWDVIKQADGYYFIFKVLDLQWKDLAEQIRVVVE